MNRRDPVKHAEAASRYREKHADKVRARMAANYRRNATARKEYSRTRKYGLSPIQFSLLRVGQQNQCAICEKQMDSPHVDHNHQTGEIRGLLCSFCNCGLGYFRDNPQSLRRAIDYLAPPVEHALDFVGNWE
jgi:hypothetical protein